MIRLFLFLFRITPKTLGKQKRIDRSSMWNSRHMTSFAEEIGDLLLWSASSTNNFHWIWRWTFVLFRAHTHRSMIRHMWRSYKRILKHRDRIFQHFFKPNRQYPFLSDCQIGRDLTRTNLSTARSWGSIECMLVEEMPRMPLSHSMSHDDLVLLVHARHQCSLAQRLFLEDLHGIRLWASYGHDWIH